MADDPSASSGQVKLNQREPFYQDEPFGWAQDELDVLEAVI